MENASNQEKPDNHVLVAVVTTSGSYPAEDFERVPANQKVRVFLKKAAQHLHIVSTENWIAKVNGREIDPEKTYEENKLRGKITIDYGPREGGGGTR